MVTPDAHLAAELEAEAYQQLADETAQLEATRYRPGATRADWEAAVHRYGAARADWEAAAEVAARCGVAVER